MKTPFRLCLVLFCALAFGVPSFADDFKPISKEELAMKDNPAAPGSNAMILELSRIDNDDLAYEEAYYRIKIFTEEGKKHADVEIPFRKGGDIGMDITGIKARTIRPDGSVVPFNGKVYQKTIVKGRGIKYLAKTFTLPEVEPGSIIEYKYRIVWDNRWLIDTHWTLQEDLFIKHAYYKIVPSTHSEYGTLWQGVRLEENQVKKLRDGGIEMEMANVPAFEEERFAPPEKELKPRLDFFYREEGLPATGDQFWKDVQKREYNAAESFIGHRGGIASAATTLVAPSDTAEQKLRKLYAKVQTLRNTNFEREKTEQEQKRDKSKTNKNSEDVLDRGYGDNPDLTGLFVALARAAGFESYMAKVSERDDTFFNRGIINARQLDAYAAYVKADGKEYWLDPATPFCPFGMLPWRKAGVEGLLLNTKDKLNFIKTPTPTSREAIIRRVANLKYADGMFKGEIQLAFSGQEALYRRISAKLEDEQSVTQDLENDLKRMLPGGSSLKLKKIEGLNDDRERLTVIYDAEVPNPPSQAGSRYLLPTSIFEHEVSPFRHETRKHPVYFSYPFQVIDAVGLTLPAEFKIEALPDRKHEESTLGYFDINWEKKSEQTIVMRRGFAVQGILYMNEYYPQLRDFYSKVGSGDEENVVLRVNQSASN